MNQLNCNATTILNILISNIELNENISLDTNFQNVDLDSITFIKVVVALESEFDFEFDDEMLLITKFPTVMSMVKYVESKTNPNCENS